MMVQSPNTCNVYRWLSVDVLKKLETNDGRKHVFCMYQYVNQGTHIDIKPICKLRESYYLFIFHGILKVDLNFQNFISIKRNHVLKMVERQITLQESWYKKLDRCSSFCYFKGAECFKFDKKKHFNYF